MLTMRELDILPDTVLIIFIHLRRIGKHLHSNVLLMSILTAQNYISWADLVPPNLVNLLEI